MMGRRFGTIEKELMLVCISCVFCHDSELNGSDWPERGANASLN
jgi:hypothetical protein